MAGMNDRIRPDKEELETRLEYTMFLMSRRLYKSDIKRSLMRKYNVSARTCENYMAEARRRMIESSGKSRDEHRMESLKFYESIIAGPDGDLRDRVYAKSRIDWLLGLEAPQKHEHDHAVHGDFVLNIVETVVEPKHADARLNKRVEDPPRPEGVSGST